MKKASMSHRFFAACVAFFLIPATVFSQSVFSGDLMLNTDVYVRDSSIGAYGTPHYDNLFSSSDAWLSLNYRNQQYQLEAGIRMDAFLNSNLHNPGVPFTGIGIGRWYISKQVMQLKITGGYFYDQFGSGTAFRAYEDRGLGIDNSILGIHLEYEIMSNWKAKGFAGVQKNLFSLYKPFIKGLNTEKVFPFSEKVQFIPGASFVNRTIDQQSMNFIVSTIESYPVDDRFVPKYNVHVYSAYATLNVWRLSLYAEGAGKTQEAIIGLSGNLENQSGNVVYGTLSYFATGIGVTAKFKRTENFSFRTSPNEILLDGVINFIPPVSRQNSLRLLTRYNPASQELQELAFGGEIFYSPKAGVTFNFEYTEITDFDYRRIYREAYLDVDLFTADKWKAHGGIQYVEYDQVFYLGEGDTLVRAITPFIEGTWRIDRRKSIRAELQQQFTEQDFGSWVYGLLEFNMAPKWSFAVSDMYNYKINTEKTSRKNHYWSAFASLTLNLNRFTLSYVKQVEGIVCTGGVCRFEPAFSGVKFTVNTSF